MDLSATELVTVVAMLVVMLFVLAIAVLIAFTIVIPFMAMLEAAAIAVPVAVIEKAALEAWTYPAGAGIRGTCPVAFVPAVMTANRIPVAFNPEKIGTRRRRWLNYDSRGWRRTILMPTPIGSAP
jgi:hypothetical protein